MRRLSFGYGSLVFAASALLGGCGGSQLQTSVPALAPSLQRPTHAGLGRSWMLPHERGGSSILIYAVDEETGDVNVYDYSNGTQVGTLTGNFAENAGCVDASGDVYLASEGNLIEYDHGGTSPLRSYNPGGDIVGCSLDAKGDLTITGSSPGKVTVYAKGNSKKAATYSNTECEQQAAMGYDNHGDIIGVGAYASIAICAVLAGAKQETTLATSGFTIDFPDGTTWDGKYIAVGDAEAGSEKEQTGLNEASLSGTTLTSHHEAILADTCYRGYVDVLNPIVVGKKNTPINDHQGNVVVGANLYCFDSGNGGGIEFWHYPKGGDPFKIYNTTDEVTVLAVSIGT